MSHTTRALALVLALLLAGGASARSRRHRERHADRPVTRAQVAKAIEPAIDAHRTPDGRVVGAEDVVRLEDVSIHISDELVGTETRVARLQAELESLRREVAELRRRHRRF